MWKLFLIFSFSFQTIWTATLVTPPKIEKHVLPGYVKVLRRSHPVTVLLEKSEALPIIGVSQLFEEVQETTTEQPTPNPLDTDPLFASSSSSELKTQLPPVQNQLVTIENKPPPLITPQLMAALESLMRRNIAVATTTQAPTIAFAPRDQSQQQQPVWMTLITTPVNFFARMIRALMGVGEFFGRMTNTLIASVGSAGNVGNVG